MCKKSITSLLAEEPCDSNRGCLSSLFYWPYEFVDLRLSAEPSWKYLHDIFKATIINLFSDQKNKAALQYVKMGTALTQALVQSHETALIEKQQKPCFQVKITKSLFSSAGDIMSTIPSRNTTCEYRFPLLLGVQCTSFGSRMCGAHSMHGGGLQFLVLCKFHQTTIIYKFHLFHWRKNTRNHISASRYKSSY